MSAAADAAPAAAPAAADGDAPAAKRQRTAPATIPAVLNEALELLESLVEEGHVNAHAHTQLAQALKRVHDVDASSQDKAVRNAVLKLAAECGFILGPVMCSEVGENLGIFEAKFMRKLFRQRMNLEKTSETGRFEPDWIEEIFEFYIQTPRENDQIDDLDMQRSMMLTLLQTAPHGRSIADDLINSLCERKITPDKLINMNDSEEFFDEYCYTNGWLEEVLDCAPEMIEAAPASDTSEWAATTRAYLNDADGSDASA